MTRKLLLCALAALSFSASASDPQAFVCAPAGNNVNWLCSVWCRPAPGETPMIAPAYTPVDPFDNLVGQGWPPGTVRWNGWYFFPLRERYHGPFLSLKEVEMYVK